MANNRSDFINFAKEQWRTNPGDIQRWAAQDDNKLLKKLARETIEAAKIGSMGEATREE